MDESKMKLAAVKIKQACGSYKCPVCQHESELDLSAGEFQTIGYDIDENGVAESGEARIIPVAVHVCPHCGFVAHFSLM